MNNVERHQYIIRKIKQDGHVTVLDLCENLKVSSVTIRKDLQFLEDSGLVYRTHGGATSQNPYQTDRTVFEKEKIHESEKIRIAKAASNLVINNDSIIIGSGTTTQFFARQLAPQGNLTVVTSALNVTLELIKHDNVEIIQLGGAVRKTSTSVTGQYAHSILDHFFCSKLFLGVDGIDLDFGISTTNAQEAILNMKMIDVAQQVIVLADSSKFGRKSFGKIVDFSKIDMIISDDIPPKFKELFDSLGIETIICRPE
ncbi:DeoR/GlpR transcriptional regulator [Sphingobacterium alkalisoli]|uniref:DeoR/GlpR transcriptional regulator n=1 Tax=Sphingobacterium alkalisoli TaxID=1874115 RepID=A0A4U0H5K3_9SPHI|nr:DeoR/GlpR family DNA-binding transcription regulator [Sphingobacterium alkalisoli]TJY66918.1 DeoR/GlpR transcriptional regulator [Sphingobacterium alkalisoli]GGH13400.1 DeoR family transcriptional regulator [Sphingobacterium alkalisoli]